MKKIAKFEKVSYSQFKNDFMDSFPQYNEKEVEENYQYVLKTLTDQAVYVPVTYTTKAYIYNPDVVSNVSYNTYLDVMYEDFTLNK